MMFTVHYYLPNEEGPEQTIHYYGDAAVRMYKFTKGLPPMPGVDTHTIAGVHYVTDRYEFIPEPLALPLLKIYLRPR